ncbi:MAG: type II toxin-antitoxin system RelE/ParE family toxin [Nanoarchaeota archaeon]
MYVIVWDTIALKELHKLEFLVAKRIVKKVKELEMNPFEYDILKLKGSTDFRLRIGDYRVIFSIEGNIISILKVGHRKNIY